MQTRTTQAAAAARTATVATGTAAYTPTTKTSGHGKGGRSKLTIGANTLGALGIGVFVRQHHQAIGQGLKRLEAVTGGDIVAGMRWKSGGDIVTIAM
jgi:hypothetical protein